MYLDFAKAFDSVNHRFLLAKLKSLRPMDQILADGKNLHGANGRCVVAGDKDQEWGTSGVSDWATSFRVSSM